MAQDKKSVLLYCDIIHTVEELEDDEAGRLFKHYLRYINDQNPVAPDKLTQVVFEPIKQNLKRDLKKWESKSERNSLIAKEAWIKRKDANAYERKKRNAKNTDKDKVTVTDKEINIHRSFKHLKITFDEYNKLIDLGYIKSQIEKVLDSIENYKKNTSYTSLYLTAKKWLEKEYPNVSADKQPYTPVQLSEVRAQAASGFGYPEWFDKQYEHLL